MSSHVVIAKASERCGGAIWHTSQAHADSKDLPVGKIGLNKPYSSGHDMRRTVMDPSGSIPKSSTVIANGTLRLLSAYTRSEENTGRGHRWLYRFHQYVANVLTSADKVRAARL